VGTLYSKPPEGSHTGGSFFHVYLEAGLLEPRFILTTHESAAAILTHVACPHVGLSLARDVMSELAQA